MTRLDDMLLVAPQPEAGSELIPSRVVAAPASSSSLVAVQLSSGETWRAPWTEHPTTPTTPAASDYALVALDSAGQPWVVAWWPASAGDPHAI